MKDAFFSRNTHKKFPRIVRGEHIYLYDNAGNKYIDGSSGTVIVNIGHGRSEIAEAMARQVEKVAFVSPVIAVNEPAEQLARELVSMLPEPLTKCYYQTSGSEAIEAAIKLVRVAHLEAGRKEKMLVISRWQSYHGSTLGSLSATGHIPRRSPFQSLLLPFPHIPDANCYHCPYGKIPDSCGLECAHALETEIIRTGPNRVSAFIAEPIVGSGGGVTIPPAGYFQAVRDICDRYDVFLIFDEIMTGFWRTGPTFAYQHWGTIPDVLVFAKGVTAGYAPLSGLLVKSDLFNLIHKGAGKFKSAGTLAGNPVACAVGLKVLEIVKREKIPEKIAELEYYFLGRLDGLRKNSIVGDVRGKGFMAALEFVEDKNTAKPFPAARGVNQKVVNAALERKLLIYGENGVVDGANGDIVMVTPPLTTTKQEIDKIVDLLSDAIEQVANELTEHK
jgi:adenosylmethionine-8-amino-7-oxononanoate aminotransferase